MVKTNKKQAITKFLIITIIAIGFTIGVNFILQKYSINGIEGYMFSQAASIVKATTPNATCSNATSSNATSSNATSSNATSSNATCSNATSSNATCSNATSPNATDSDVAGVNISEEKKAQIIQEVNAKLQEDYQEKHKNGEVSFESYYNENFDTYYNNRLEEVKKEESKDKIVTFLEDNKIYVIIIAIATMTAIITGVILIVDKKTKKIQ